MAEKINVVWKSYHTDPNETGYAINRGYWDNGLLEDIFKQLDVEHHDNFDWVKDSELPNDPERVGAVVIINGRTHIEDTAAINEDIAKLAWVLFIDTGDEESSFPWRKIKHPVMRVWIMMPRMNTHDDVSFHLPNGYRNETHEYLQEIGFSEKVYDWFFAGQVNHARREDCAYYLDHLDNKNGMLVTSNKFGEEIMPYKQYLAQMTATKIALCPSGIESPDNFRLNGNVPFPIISYWDKITDLLPELLKGYPENANRAFAWWQLKKREIKYKLLDDIKELSK